VIFVFLLLFLFMFFLFFFFFFWFFFFLKILRFFFVFFFFFFFFFFLLFTYRVGVGFRMDPSEKNTFLTRKRGILELYWININYCKLLFNTYPPSQSLFDSLLLVPTIIACATYFPHDPLSCHTILAISCKGLARDNHESFGGEWVTPNTVIHAARSARALRTAWIMYNVVCDRSRRATTAVTVIIVCTTQRHRSHTHTHTHTTNSTAGWTSSYEYCTLYNGRFEAWWWAL